MSSVVDLDPGGAETFGGIPYGFGKNIPDPDLT
jgi:hypothetical protein